jgi:hypothetical protein
VTDCQTDTQTEGQTNKVKMSLLKLLIAGKIIDKTKKVTVHAYKINNKHLMYPAEYNELLEKNIQADYRKEIIENVDNVQDENTDILNKLSLEKSVFKTTKWTAFLKIKDQKENIMNDPKARLINPNKPEIGKISKQILENVENVIRNKSKINCWKNTGAVLIWFRKLKNKKRKL